jgi:hypothetical protein
MYIAKILLKQQTFSKVRGIFKAALLHQCSTAFLYSGKNDEHEYSDHANNCSGSEKIEFTRILIVLNKS